MRHYSRHYYVSDNLNDLEKVEEELEANDVFIGQIHVLSDDDAGLQRHEHLHAVPSIMKQDFVRATERGAVVGAGMAALVLMVVSLTRLPESVGWPPFVLLAIVMFGFCIWESSFLGFQSRNVKFIRFEGDLHKGKHVFFVDIESHQESVLDEVLKAHPKLSPAGTGDATPDWLLQLQCHWYKFRKEFS